MKHLHYIITSFILLAFSSLVNAQLRAKQIIVDSLYEQLQVITNDTTLSSDYYQLGKFTLVSDLASYFADHDWLKLDGVSIPNNLDTARRLGYTLIDSTLEVGQVLLPMNVASLVPMSFAPTLPYTKTYLGPGRAIEFRGCTGVVPCVMPYLLSAYITERGYLATGAGMLISNKRKDVDGEIQGVSAASDGSEPNMLGISIDINGPALALEAHGTLTGGANNATALAIYNMDAIIGGLTPYSQGYGAKQFAISGSGQMYWGSNLGIDPVTNQDLGFLGPDGSGGLLGGRHLTVKATASQAYLALNGPATGQNEAIRFQKNGVDKWQIFQTTVATSDLHILGPSSTYSVSMLGSNGNVGIGEDAPQKKLHVTGEARVTASGGTATTITGRDAEEDITDVGTGWGLDLTSGNIVVDSTQVATQHDITLIPDLDWIKEGTASTVPTNTENMFHMAEVGIGTNTPRGPLDVDNIYIGVAGATHGYLRSAEGIFLNTDYDNSGGDGSFHIQNSGTDKLTIEDDGDVGIGIAAPSQRLHVQNGLLKVVSNDNTATTNIGSFYANNETIGVGLTYEAIRVVGSNANISYSMLSKGTGDVWIGQDNANTGYRINPTDAGLNNIWFGNRTVGLTADSGNKIHIGQTSSAATGLTVTTTTGSVGINDITPSQILDVNGTARITGSDGTATTVTGRDGDGDISNVAIGSGLSLTAGTLSATAVSDHGLLTGLLDDDHTQYALLAGRSLGQLLNGGDAANEDLTLEGTAHATKTTSYLLLQTTGGLVGIGTTAPDKILEINLGTGNAIRSSYNDGNGSAATFMDQTLSSAGMTTFNATGSTPAFNFSDKTFITSSGAAATGITGTDASGFITGATLAAGLSIVAGALTPADVSATNELNTIEEGNVSVQTGNLDIDFQAMFDVVTDGATEVNVSLDLSEATTQTTAETDDWMLMYDAGLARAERMLWTDFVIDIISFEEDNSLEGTGNTFDFNTGIDLSAVGVEADISLDFNEFTTDAAPLDGDEYVILYDPSGAIQEKTLASSFGGADGNGIFTSTNDGSSVGNSLFDVVVPGKLSFDDDALADLLMIDGTSARVGIGVGSPEADLHIRGLQGKIKVDGTAGNAGTIEMEGFADSGNQGGITFDFTDADHDVTTQVAAASINMNKESDLDQWSSIKTTMIEGDDAYVFVAEKFNEFSNNTKESHVSINGGLSLTQTYEWTAAGSDLTLDRSYYNVYVTGSGAIGDEINLPNVFSQPASDNWDNTMTAADCQVGQEYVISNYRASTNLIVRTNTGDFIDGISASTATILPGGSLIIKCIRFTTVGYWQTYD